MLRVGLDSVYPERPLEHQQPQVLDVPEFRGPRAGGLMKSYIILENLAVEKRRFLLQERLTIGRKPSNDICTLDPTVSRRHAVVYFSKGKVYVEDLGSLNGTYVNGNRVQKAVLSSGDTLSFGDVVFRFLQEQVEPEHAHWAETQELPRPEIRVSSERPGPSSQARRLAEAIAKVPLFSRFEEDDLDEVIKVAQLVVYDTGRPIIREGEWGRSLYIILEGSASVLTHHFQGEEIELQSLAEGQVFGEGSFLKETPCTATVQASEKALLCQVNLEDLKDFFDKRPVIREQFELYCQARERNIEAKKIEAGIIDRRSHARLNLNLPVSFSIAPSKRVTGKLKGKVFRCFSENISLSGIRIRVQDQTLFDLPLGCMLRFEISLPHPWKSISCTGALKYNQSLREGKNLGCLGAQFVNVPRATRTRLEEFLREALGV